MENKIQWNEVMMLMAVKEGSQFLDSVTVSRVAGIDEMLVD